MSKSYEMLIGGEWCPASTGENIESSNPATEELLWTIPKGSASDVEKAITAAGQAFKDNEWRSFSYKDHADLLREIGDLILENAVALAEIETKENGKPIKESSLIDIPEAAETFKTFASLLLAMKGETFPCDGTTLSYTLYEPLGVVAAIIPWNYPLLMAAWKIAPAIAAGNTIVIKPSELTSATLLELGKLLEQTAIPDGVINIVTGTGEEAGQALVSHPKVEKVSFTGSTETGKQVLQSCAENSTPSSMELGGKSATIVTEGVNVEKVLKSLLTTIFMNQGQMCTAGSRMLVQSSLYDEVLAGLKEKLSQLTITDGLSPTSDMGPLISKEHKEKVLAMIDDAIAEGATVEYGQDAVQLPESGNFVAPTILSGVSNSSTIWHEEVFGPVLVITPFDTIEEAITLANESSYGLALSIWSRDTYAIQKISREVKVGRIWVNTYGNFSNEVPFGGTKASGFGKELGLDALKANCLKKSVTMDITPDETPLVAQWYGV